MVEKHLPFGVRTCQQLMHIARDERISNAIQGSYLPADWRTLSQISRLDDDTFHRAIDDGTINPNCKRSTIMQLLNGCSDEPVQAVKVEPLHASVVVSGSFDKLIESGVKWATVYADPPWQYGNQATRAATDNHYPTMTTDEICALPVGSIVADTGHLHLWTTNGFLREAFSVIEAWGFEFKSAFIWAKPQMGIGNYWRVSHEYLLLGTRGSATFRSKSLKSWAELDRSEHSTKPGEVRKMIEEASPSPMLELFARRVYTGWSAWGNQIDKGLFHECV